MRILDISYSPVASDPRVLRQIDWLQEAGRIVDVAGLGEKPNSLKGEYYQIGVPNLAIRLCLYVFATKSYRHKTLIISQIPETLRARVHQGYYDAIHLNDLEFVPVVNAIQHTKNEHSTKTHFSIDLHEYFPGVKGGIFWTFFVKSFNKWLFRQLIDTNFDGYSTVSEQIVQEYVDEFDFPKMEVVWNAPKISDCVFEFRDLSEIKLVYHGNTGRGRPVFRYINAVKRSHSPITLHFMITSGTIYRNTMRLFALINGVSQRVHFHEPVPVQQISQKLEQYDLELVWFPPVSRSLHLSLANKFFEAVQAGLGVVIGKSPSMEPLVNKFGIGAISNGWKTRDLVEVLDSLDRELVEKWRLNSFQNRFILSSDHSRLTFLDLVIPIEKV